MAGFLTGVRVMGLTAESCEIGKAGSARPPPHPSRQHHIDIVNVFPPLPRYHMYHDIVDFFIISEGTSGGRILPWSSACNTDSSYMWLSKVACVPFLSSN